MKVTVVILAGGEGSRLGILTAKRTKPAVPFAGKYRIIDFALSNCVNSGLFDVMIIAQYRPQSLIEHIGSGGPWDLNRELVGGIRIYTPYKARRPSDWFTGTADAIQQNYLFIKRNKPDLIIILSGDHIYAMDYRPMIDAHLANQADLTMATIPVSRSEASRFGILGVDQEGWVTSFVEKPLDPPSSLANMGVYIFNTNLLNQALWEDHTRTQSSHDFGKDVIPAIISSKARVFAFPYTGYWVDVGTYDSYWRAHMDLLSDPPALDLNNRDWIIHTRTEERPPVSIREGAQINDSMISDGCIIEPDSQVYCSVLSPGVRVCGGASVMHSVVLTDAIVGSGAQVQRAILDKAVWIQKGARVGSIGEGDPYSLAMIGKRSIVPEGVFVEPGGSVGTDVIPSDYNSDCVTAGEYVQTRRLPNEV